jgi:hypothetical protein
MTPYPSEIEQQMQRLYSSLNEKDRRRYAGIESVKLGWGGMSYISHLLGCDYYTLRLGIEELKDESSMSMSGIRREGGGRKSALESIEGLDAAFLRVLVQHTAGSPMDESVKWTNLTRHEIAELLKAEGVNVSVTVVDQLLKRHHYRKRKAQKRFNSQEHPLRNEQFEHIECLIESYQAAGNPVISMDTKKKN